MGGRAPASKWTSALAGVGTVVVLGLIVALAIGLFRGELTESVPVTVVADRAGLVMNPDARVKMRGVQVGQVDSIEERPDGKAVLHLALNPEELQHIPSNIRLEVASSTVFGAKYVEFVPPPDPDASRLAAGQVIESQHVTVEINTVFQQLVQVLDKIDPAKLNQTLGAVATAVDGRGDQIGTTLVDLNSVLGRLEPSLPNLSRDLQAALPVLQAYGDVSPDLLASLESLSSVSNTLVDTQPDLDTFLVSATGLADVGDDVIGADTQGLADTLHYLVPTAELLNEYRESLWCSAGGLIPFTKSPPQFSGILASAGLTLGVERYKYPRDLPKVAAKSGGANYCQALGLPDMPAEFRAPVLMADTGSNLAQYGNSGILLNSDGLKNWLFGPLDGPPRNSAQVGMPG
jgi:phospholipid/cholesterol/gamma-HCH transport system substrate-binding protein